MVNRILSSLLFVLTLFSCTTRNNEVLIKGAFNGELPSEIKFTKPVEGITSWYFISEADVDSLGNFEIKLETDKALILGIRITQKLGNALVVEPGQEYEVQIDLSSEQPTISMDGEGKVGFDAFSNMPSMMSSQTTASKLYKERETYAEIFQEIERQQMESLSVFDSLFTAELISTDFFDVVQSKIDCFYKAVKSNVYNLKFQEALDGGEFSEEEKKAWKAVFSDVSWDQLSRSPAFYELQESYLRSQVFTNEDFDVEELRAKYKQERFHTYQLNQAEQYIEEPFLHQFKANYLFQNAMQNRFEKELISLYEQFKQDYPQSQFSENLDPMIEPIVAYHDKIEKPFGENVKFVTNPEETNSLKDAVKELRGRKVYVDVWATWCGPCKAEFEHKEQLEEVLQKHNVASLYISIDRPENEQKWNEMIKYYELDGHHIRTNKSLNMQLREIFDKEGSLYIPWYLLLDEEGNIVNKNFVRPSNIEELEKELAKVAS